MIYLVEGVMSGVHLCIVYVCIYVSDPLAVDFSLNL